MSKSLLVSVDGAAGLLLLAMTDLDSSMRLLVAAALVVNLLLLVGTRALLTRPARLGAWASLIGYAGTVVSWLVLAVVTPLIATCVTVSLAGLPVGRICGVFVKNET